MRIISLGWGVQSFALAAMAALGEIEPVAFAIHADTTHESILTYQFAERWTPWLAERGVEVVTAIADAPVIIRRGGGKIYIPAFTDTPSHSGGMLRRQCTQRWKIAPMRREIQRRRNGQQVDQLLGISLDEFQRMRDSDVKYITNRYPLIEMKMTRTDCELWLIAHGLEIPPKSACTFCPFHNTAEWRRIKATPEDWKEATEVDNAIRDIRPPYDLYVHPSRKPLEDVDLRTETEKGQLSLWDSECSGICGV